MGKYKSNLGDDSGDDKNATAKCYNNTNKKDFSILKKTKILRGQNLIWSSRSLEEFAICSELLAKLVVDDRFNIQLYLTRSDDAIKQSLKDGSCKVSDVHVKYFYVM